MSDEYYVIQQFRGSTDSGVDRLWRNGYVRPTTLATAMKEFNYIITWVPRFNTRLVKAFYCRDNQTEIVREVIQYREGK